MLYLQPITSAAFPGSLFPSSATTRSIAGVPFAKKTTRTAIEQKAFKRNSPFVYRVTTFTAISAWHAGLDQDMRLQNLNARCTVHSLHSIHSPLVSLTIWGRMYHHHHNRCLHRNTILRYLKYDHGNIYMCRRLQQDPLTGPIIDSRHSADMRHLFREDQQQ